MNFDHRADRKLITGKSGSGKTTLFLALLRAHRARWKFVFDPEREVARKLGWPVCRDVPGLKAAVKACRPACFDPTAMPEFSGDRPGAFAFFCAFVLNVCRVLHGPKLFAVDEIQTVQSTGNGNLPGALSQLMDEGRRQEIDSLFISQSVNRVHDRIRVQLTEIFTFCHTDRLALAWLEENGFDPEEVSALAVPGGFVRRNLVTGEMKKNHANPQRSNPAPAPRPRPAVPLLRRPDGRWIAYGRAGDSEAAD